MENLTYGFTYFDYFYIVHLLSQRLGNQCKCACTLVEIKMSTDIVLQNCDQLIFFDVVLR